MMRPVPTPYKLDSFQQGNFYATAMLCRTVLNHVPPIFGMTNFDGVANNYGTPNENKSFKKNMKYLGESLKHIADQHLHSKIRKRETLPTETQIDFKPAFHVLLGEIIRISN